MEYVERPVYILFFHELVVLHVNLDSFEKALIVFPLLRSQNIVRLSQVQTHILQQTRHHGGSGTVHAKDHDAIDAARCGLRDTAGFGLET